MTRILFAALVAAAIGLTGTAQAESLTMPARQYLDAKGVKPITGEALKTLVTGNTLYHIVPQTGFRVPLHYLPDGTRFVRIRGQ